MRLGGGQCFKTRATKQRLQAFNKLWNPGDKLRVIYPIFYNEEEGEYDLLVGALWGYSWDPKVTSLKRIFIPTLAPINENGDPEYKDICAKMVPLAKLLNDGQRRVKEIKIEKHPTMSESSKDAALKKIKIEYEGDSEGMNRTAYPVIRSLEYKIFTECVVIPVDDNDNPQWKKATIASQDLTQQRYEYIKEAINDKKNYIDPEGKFAEVSYAFKQATTKGLAGDVKPLGLDIKYAFTYIDENEASEAKQLIHRKTMNLVRRLPDDSDIIIKRNSNSKPVFEADIRQAFTTYCTENYDAFDAIESEADIEIAKKNIEAINLFEIPVSSGPILELIEEYKTEQAEKEEQEAEVNTGAPTIDEIERHEKFEEGELDDIKKDASEGMGDATADAGLEIESGAEEHDITQD